MDQLDREILNVIQSDLPVSARPYAEVAGRVGLDEAEVIARVQAMKDQGIIRRIGGNVSSRSVGYVSTLCAARVPEASLELFAAEVNRRPGVTHNYLRQAELNVWFTMISPSQAELEAELAAITAATGVPILNLPAVKTFKIQVDFEF